MASVILLFSALQVAPACAQGDDVGGLVEGAESAELRALREFELELFGGQPVAEVSAAEAGVRVSDGAAAVTADGPPAVSEAPAQVSGDLSWMRGLTLPDIPIRWDARVIRFLEFFRDDPRGRRFIRGWLRRLARYGPTIRRTLREQGLPRDLIFVAMVESGFDPTARSGAGAAGMWQFVQRTGEELGLPVNHWVDRRLDPEASTAAAGRYLHMLHRRFGTWELAFAAYNMGYGALLRAIRKYNTNDYWELSHLESGLPYETNLYVSKIIACAIVAHNQARFGFTDLVMEPAIEWDTVEVPGGVGLRLIARTAGSDVATIRQLNPSLRRSRTPPGGPSRVHIPHGSAARFATRWARARPGHPIPRPHVVRFGETLGDVARDHGTSESALRRLNEFGERQVVGAGMHILVPVVRRRRAVEEPSEPPVIAVPEGPTELPGRRRIFYRVVRRDRLEAIARFFRVSADDLRRWNGLDAEAALQSGMYLQLFVTPELDLSRALVITPDEARVLVVGSEDFFAYHEGQNGRIRFRYEVQPGDTLSEIGHRFGIRTASLARINQMARHATLRAGASLIIYAEPNRVPRALRPPEPAAESTESEESEPESTPTSEESATAPEATGSEEDREIETSGDPT